MSSAARWIIAIFSLFCAVSFTVVAVAAPTAFEPKGMMGWLLVLLFPLFCLAITVTCFPGPLRSIAARFLGGCVFALSIAYIVSEIGKPFPDLSNYRRSDTHIVNAILFFLVFGLPGACVLFKGRFPGSDVEEHREALEECDYDDDDEGEGHHTVDAPGPRPRKE